MDSWGCSTVSRTWAPRNLSLPSSSWGFDVAVQEDLWSSSHHRRSSHQDGRRRKRGVPPFRHFVVVEPDGPETAVWPPLIAGEAGKSSISVDRVPSSKSAFRPWGQNHHPLASVVFSAAASRTLPVGSPAAPAHSQPPVDGTAPDMSPHVYWSVMAEIRAVIEVLLRTLTRRAHV